MKKYIFILTILMASISLFAQETQNTLYGQIEGFKMGRKVELQLEVTLFDQLREDNTVVLSRTTLLDSLGKFKISYPVAHNIFYISLKLLNDGGQVPGLTQTLFDFPFLAEATDSVMLYADLTRRKIEFSNKGGEKMQCQASLKLMKIPDPLQNRIFALSGQNFAEMLPLNSKATLAWLAQKKILLESYRGKISDVIYKRIAADMESKFKADYVYYATMSHNIGIATRKPIYQNFVVSNDQYFDSLFSEKAELEDSPDYISFLIQRERLNYYMKEFKSGITYFTWLFNVISRKYNGELRDRLLNAIFIENIQRHERDLLTHVEKAKTLFSSPAHLSFFQDWQSKQQMNSDAFNFVLWDENGKEHRLTDYKDKVLLLDFWFYGCKGCTQIPPQLEKIRAAIGDKDVVYLSVNIDLKREWWLNGLKAGIYSKPWQVELNTRGESNPIIKYYNIKIYPRLILIGKNGKLISSNPPDPRKDEGKEIIKLIQAAL